MAPLLETVSIICITVALKLFCPESLGTVQRIKIQQYKYLSMSQVKQREVLKQNLLSRTLLYQERVFKLKVKALNLSDFIQAIKDNQRATSINIKA